MMSCGSLVGEDVQLSTSIKTNSPCELQGKTTELMSCFETLKFYRTFESEQSKVVFHRLDSVS